ncbi:pyridoxamine 5'-phosphate oxidase family protein [Hasllibacter sp. MH4015]|uniref:pyridoxamine 5'-phosphate oxidase family protein n=1 Tax=Hasllibacter sp. MH4015 TaxID=2854029 RepID=UPI001CD3AE0E
MQIIEDIERLEALYGAPAPNSVAKVTPRLTPHYRTWIDAARFVILSTVGPEGTDASPRGDDGPVVRIVDDTTLWLPDWRGNNRIDSLRNIVRDGRVSLMFMVPGAHSVVRINGTAKLSVDPDLTESFEQKGRHPKSVIVVSAEEVYFQCAKALMRSDLWARDDAEGLPTAGAFIKEMVAEFDGDTYDKGYPEYAKAKMW